MMRHMRISVAFVKRDWGSGVETWCERKTESGRYSVRRLNNRESKKRWFGGTSLKAY